MLTIWSLCLLHKSGPVMCNVCLSCPYYAFSVEGVWVRLRKSLTRSPTSGSEGVKKKIFVWLGPGNLWDSVRVPQGSGCCEAILVDVHLSASIRIDRDMSNSRPVLLTWQTGAEVPWGWGSGPAFLKTAGPENCLVLHLAVKHWTIFIISSVYICAVSLWVSLGAYYCSMVHQVHCS